MKKAPAQFDFAIDPAKRRTKNGKKVGRPKRPRSKVAHVRRESVDARHPLHVTLRLARGLPNLRYVRAARVIEDAIETANGRYGLGVLEYSIEPDHIHLLTEIDKSQAEYRREGQRWVGEVRRARNDVRRNAHHHGHLNEGVPFDRLSSARSLEDGPIPVVRA